MTVTRFTAPASARAITHLVGALEVLDRLSHRPPEPELVCLALGATHRPIEASRLTAPRLAGIGHSSAAIELVAWALEAAPAHRTPDRLIVGSVPTTTFAGEQVLASGEGWHRLDDVCAEAGCELIEWMVITPDRVVLPREVAGMPARLHLGAPPG